MKILIALGGNALLLKSEKPDINLQRKRLQSISRSINILARSHNLIITHGNGPQIGLIAYESEIDEDLLIPYSIDTLGAETQGMIGYWISQIIEEKYKPIVIFTRVLVDKGNTYSKKFIGRSYSSKEEAEKVAKKYNWKIDLEGKKWRRVISSPLPIDVIETQAIKFLVEKNYTIICGGGGGVPIDKKTKEGIEGVVDKDLTSSIIAQKLDVELLLIATDVPGIYTEWHGKPESKYFIANIACSEIKKIKFNKIIQPKIQSIVNYVCNTKKVGVVGLLSTIEELADNVLLEDLNATRIYCNH